MKYVKWMGLSSLILVSIFVCIVGFVVSSWGARLGLSIADNMLDELSIDYKSGGLGSELVLSRLQWQQDAVDVSVEEIKLQLDLSCILGFSLCIDTLEVGNVVVKVMPQKGESPAEESEGPITLPINVLVKNLEIGQLSVAIQDQLHITWQSLKTHLQFYKSLDVTELSVNNLIINSLTNPQSKTSVDKPFELANWQYQPLSPIDFQLPLSFTLKQAKIAPFTFQADGEQQVVVNFLALEASGQPNSLLIKQLQLKHDMAQLSVQGKVAFDGIMSHELNIEGQMSVRQYGATDFTLHSKGDMNNLALNAELSGAASLTLDADLKPANELLPMELKLDWRDLQWPLSNAVDAEIKSSLGHVAIRGDLAGLDIQSTSQLSGKAIPATSLELSAQANRKQVQLEKLVAQTLEGKITAQGVTRLDQTLSTNGTLIFEHINPGVFHKDYQGDINGQLIADVENSTGQWQAHVSDLDLHGTWRDFPLTVSGKAAFDTSNKITLDKLTIVNGANSLLVNGVLSEDKALDFDLHLKAPQISQSIADVSGSLQADAKISGSVAAPSFAYTIAGNKLALAEINIESLSGQGEVLWNEQKPINVTLQLKQIQGIQNQVDKADISLSGNANSHMLIIDTTSNKTNLQAKIEGSLGDNAWQGRWLEGKIESTYASLNLVTPFDISANWQTQQYAISEHCWRQQSSDLCINQASFKNHEAKWDIALHDLNLFPLVHRLVPQFPAVTSESKLSMTLQGHWIIDQLPEAKLHANLSPAKWSFKNKQDLSLDLQKFDVNAQISSNNLNVQATMSGPEIGALTLDLQGEAGDFAEQLARPINGEFSLRDFNLAPFKILMPELDKLEGELVGSTTISGTLQQPLFNGEINLNNGAVQSRAMPIVVSGVQQKIQLIDDKALISGTYLLGKGAGNIEGQVSWQPQLQGQLTIKGDGLEFDYQSMLRAQVSPDINIHFFPDLVKVEGDVIVPYARFKLRELPQGSISPSKDVVMADQEAKEREAEQLLQLNLKVLIDPKKANQVKLDAFGLTTDVRGNLQIQNGKNGMVANGDMQLVNGRYKAYGQNLIIREGDITFNGQIDRPFLNIEAVRDPELTEDEVVAGIRVEGSTDSPQVEVFSEPAMEQQQSLSYMLTGRGLGSSSGDSQDTMLTNMLLSFGLGQSENLVSNIGQKLGFKDVSLDTSGQGDGTQLSVTGYVAPGVQLRYGVGVFDSVSEVAIRYQLMPQLYLEAVSGLSNAIDIYYSFSIEGSENKKTEQENQ